MGHSVTFVLGKPAERTPVIAAVVAALRAGGLSVRTVVPSRGEELPSDLDDDALVVQRGLTTQALAELAPWAHKCCNDPIATEAVQDRGYTMATLAAAGVPVPQTRVLADYARARRAGPDQVIKSVDARAGRGAAVLLPGDPAPEDAPFDGPYLVQQHVRGWEAKLYVFGDQVRGLARPGGSGQGGRVAPRRSGHAALARQTGRALGLELFGVDVIASASGAQVVDVNPFPSAAAIEANAELITAHLRARLAAALSGDRCTGPAAPGA